MKRLLVLLLVIILPDSLSAQPIHGNPQKASYDGTGTDYPTLSSQVHWLFPNSPMGMPSHTHVDCAFPDGMEIGNISIKVPCIITTYHTPGVVRTVMGNINNSFKDFTFDSSQAFRDKWGATVANWDWAHVVPVSSLVTGGDGNSYLLGNPDGVTAITGEGTIDVAGSHLHGWYPVGFMVRTFFSNGDVEDAIVRSPLFFVTDLSLPEAPSGDGSGRPIHACVGGITSAREPNVNFGENVIEIDQVLPLFGPVSSTNPWTHNPKGYSYGESSLPNGTLEVFLDPSLHADPPIIGTLLVSKTAFQVVDTLFSIPGDIADGPHKYMSRWSQPGPVGSDEILACNLVFTANTGPGGVAQPGEVAPPIVIPPPVETQTWQNVVPEFQQLFDSVTGFLAQFKICANGICQVIH